ALGSLLSRRLMCAMRGIFIARHSVFPSWSDAELPLFSDFNRGCRADRPLNAGRPGACCNPRGHQPLISNVLAGPPSALRQRTRREISMQHLRERALRGGFAKVCSQGTILAIRLGTLVVLARLIDPKDFGLVGMVTVVTGVFSLFRDAGLSVATVQRPSISE